MKRRTALSGRTGYMPSESYRSLVQLGFPTITPEMQLRGPVQVYAPAPGPQKRAVGDVDGAAAAAGVGGGMLLLSAAVIAALGVTGYYWGRAVAPNEKSRKLYGTAGAASNIVLPVVGPTVLTFIGASKS